MKKKQLHIVNKYYLPVLAGIETCISETYSRFSPDEWNITIHTSADSLDAPNSLPEEEIDRGMNIIRYKTRRGIFVPLIPWTTADIVVLNNFSVSPVLPVLVQGFALKLVGLKRAKMVLAPHGGYTPNWSHFVPWQAHIKKFLHNVVGKFLINATVDAVHSVAEWERERLIAAGLNPVRIHVIPNGVEDVAFNRSHEHVSAKTKKLVKKSGDYILAISRIHPLKNIEVAIKSLTHVPEHIKLVILGQNQDEAYYGDLVELIQVLGLTDRVVFAGAITGGDKYHVINNAIAMVHTSRFEVDPLVIKECLTQGTICVAANNTGTGRLIVDGVNGYLVPTFDENKLAEVICHIIDNPRGRENNAVRKYNRDNRDLYRWTKASGQIQLLFTNLLSQWSLSYS